MVDISSREAWELACVLAGGPLDPLAFTSSLAIDAAAAMACATNGDRRQAFDAWLLTLDTATELTLSTAIAAQDPMGPAPSHGKPAPKTTWTHHDLMQTQFPVQLWLVDGLVPDEALTVLGGRKKLGKSWLCIQIAQGVATGQPVLGRATVQGKVIYLCLEDGERRLKSRLEKQGAPSDLPIIYITQFRPLDKEGMGDLEQLIEDEAPKLVIIDTLAACKTGKTDENSAGDMADIANHLRRMAQDFHLGILVAAHHGKATFGDPGDDIRGSSAVAAAADENIGLYKADATRLLKAEGRDIEPLELRIEFDAAFTWAWQLVGDARQLARDEAEAAVIDALRVLGRSDAGPIAREVDKTRQTVTETLKRLRQAGKVKSAPQMVGKTTKVFWEIV